MHVTVNRKSPELAQHSESSQHPELLHDQLEYSYHITKAKTAFA